MSTTRRSLLGGALAASLLAQATAAGTAAAATTGVPWDRLTDGWAEIRWTADALQRMRRHRVTVEALAPATLLETGGGLRLPLHSGRGRLVAHDLPATQGRSTMDGGLVLRTETGEVRASEAVGVLRGEEIIGHWSVNGKDTGAQPVFTVRLSQGSVALEPASDGGAPVITVSDVPVYASKESLVAFEEAFGTPVFSTEEVLAHVTASGRYEAPPL